jgi:hypothetical protein
VKFLMRVSSCDYVTGPNDLARTVSSDIANQCFSHTVSNARSHVSDTRYHHRQVDCSILGREASCVRAGQIPFAGGPREGVTSVCIYRREGECIR